LNHEGHEEHEAGLQDETLDAILELRDVEIDQQSDFDVSKLHVGQQLEENRDVSNFLTYRLPLTASRGSKRLREEPGRL
jgi:hypothetical protein